MRISYKDFTVILPTLNEKRTIGEMISYMLRNYRGSKVIVVDDGSDDGTQDIVKGISRANGNVSLVDRSTLGLRRGLTFSVIDGARRCTTKYFVVIDADMQHPPGRIKDIANALSKGDDLVVANRASVTDWALYRKIISKSLIYMGKGLLLLGSKATCVDIFSGFFGVRRELFISVYNRNKHRFVGEGYKVLYDFLKCVDKNTLKIGNVPYVFRVREFGASKAGVSQGLALFRSFFS